jgi:uncharacterized protein YkvS
MTDQDLLALAAKAISGINGKTLVYEGDIGWIFEYADGTRGSWWNPLTCDADALRLAVALDMDMFSDADNEGPLWSAFALCKLSLKACGSTVYYDSDSAQALRRAIVITAAEVGRNIQ